MEWERIHDTTTPSVKSGRGILVVFVTDHRQTASNRLGYVDLLRIGN